ASIHIGKAHLRGCAGHHHRGAEGLEGHHGGIAGGIVGNQETEVVKADIVGPLGESVQVNGRPIEARLDQFDLGAGQGQMGQVLEGDLVAVAIPQVVKHIQQGGAHAGLQVGDGGVDVAGDVAELIKASVGGHAAYL